MKKKLAHKKTKKYIYIKKSKDQEEVGMKFTIFIDIIVIVDMYNLRVFYCRAYAHQEFKK